MVIGSNQRCACSDFSTTCENMFLLIHPLLEDKEKKISVQEFVLGVPIEECGAI